MEPIYQKESVIHNGVVYSLKEWEAHLKEKKEGKQTLIHLEE